MYHERSNVPSSKNCAFCCFWPPSFLHSGFVLHLCVAGAVTLTGSFFFVRAEGVALLQNGKLQCLFHWKGGRSGFLIWEGWHQRWSSPLCCSSSPLFFHLCVAWAVTLTGSFFFVRAEGVALLLPYLGGVASKVIFTSLLFFISVVLSPLCSLSCHPHRFFLLCQSGGFAALLLPYLGGVASKVIFISLLNLFLCTTLVLVYLAWSPCTTLVLVYLAWSPWVYLGIHYYYLDKGLSYSQLQFWSKK